MARYTQSSIERVRDAVDMVELVGAKTELRKSGQARWQGLCPFHDERTPSFGIDPQNKLYHCFGCGAGGDAIRFVEETEGVSFREAVELLADRFRVELELEQEDPGEADRRARQSRLYELLERTAAFYVRFLWEAGEAGRAREYLASRGLEEAVLREFRVGYAPKAWDTVLMASRRAGFSEAELAAAGLVARARDGGRVYDRFRERIMFPLADLRGRVLGFGARAMRSDQGGPKYLNTSENELYHKGRQLFGADLARAPAAKAGSVIVAEGYTDVIAMHQAGMRNSVGLMGTAMTEQQLAELSRMAPVVHFALDADAAGQDAMIRAAKVAAGRKVELRVVPLPAGSDPADLVQAEGGEAVRELVDRSIPFVRFRVERELARGDLSAAEGKDRVLEELRPVFAAIPASVQRDELLRLVAERMAITPDLAASLLAESSARASAQRSVRPAAPSRGSLDRGERTERIFLALCIALPREGAEALADVDVEAHFSVPVTRRAAMHLREHLTAPAEGLPEDDTELRDLVTELSVRAAQGDPHPVQLEVERLQLERQLVERRLAEVRTQGGGVAALAADRERIQEELAVAVGRAAELEKD